MILDVGDVSSASRDDKHKEKECMECSVACDNRIGARRLGGAPHDACKMKKQGTGAEARVTAPAAPASL